MYAKTKRETITFQTNITVNGTVLKKGTYELKFDDKSNELSVLKGGKVVARATASVEKRNKKADCIEFRSTGSGDDQQLISVTFSGANHAIVINPAAAAN